MKGTVEGTCSHGALVLQRCLECELEEARDRIAELETAYEQASSLLSSQNEAMDQMLRDAREIDQLLSDLERAFPPGEGGLLERIQKLGAQLARLRLITRTAVQLQQSEEWARFWNSRSGQPPPGRFLALSNAVDALSPKERSELLKEE